MGKKKVEPEEPEVPLDENGNPIDVEALARAGSEVTEEMISSLIDTVALEVRDRRKQAIIVPMASCFMVNDALRVSQWYAISRDDGSVDARVDGHEEWSLEKEVSPPRGANAQRGRLSLLAEREFSIRRHSI